MGLFCDFLYRFFFDGGLPWDIWLLCFALLYSSDFTGWVIHYGGDINACFCAYIGDLKSTVNPRAEWPVPIQGLEPLCGQRRQDVKVVLPSRCQGSQISSLEFPMNLPETSI